ncbi:MAG: DUF2089 domain-containing protein [Chloroflexi bacterium]|nr:DUF2089 domain-containing protein [Chloroflexota bacterium]
MYPLLGNCPVCGGELAVTTLTCRECDTTIQGRFTAGPFSALNPQQLEFVELFVRNEGKITRMEAELGLSYPTIRNRLHEVIRALGYEPGGEDASGLTEDDRRTILEDLETGKINYEEAMRLLKESE